MILTKIMLYLSRPATEDEIDEYRYYQDLFDGMSLDERSSQGLRKPTDLAPEGADVRNVVYYHLKKHPLYNEVYEQKGSMETGVPNATLRFKQIVATMLKENVRKHHVSYYVVGEFEEGGREVGFRTLVKRTEI